MTLSLSACGGGPSSSPDAIALACPDPIPYTDAEAELVADELDVLKATLGRQPQTSLWIGDYLGLRDELRAVNDG